MDNESVLIIHDAGLVHDDATTITPPPHTSASLASSFAVAIPVEETSSFSNVPIMWQQRKQDDKCCGCCCDHRWAVIILSIIRFVILVIASSILIFDIREWSLEIFLMIVYMSMSIVSWVGAVKYSICLVAIDLVWCVAGFFIVAHLTLRDNTWFAMESTAIFAVVTISVMYPHIGFILNVRRSTTMSQNPREE